MTTSLATQLAVLQLDYTDTDTVIEEDEERKDALGDLPNWDEMSMTQLLRDYYYKHKGQWKAIESKLGDGYWTGVNEHKADAYSESINQLARAEVLLSKALPMEMVQHLAKLAMPGIWHHEDHKNNSWDALLPVYTRTRQTRITEIQEYKSFAQKMLRATGNKASMSELYKRTVAYTTEVSVRAQESIDSSAYRKEQRDNYIQSIKATLGAKFMSRNVWRFYNSLYWFCLFGWNQEEPSEFMKNAASWYVSSLSYHDTIHGVEEQGSDIW